MPSEAKVHATFAVTSGCVCFGSLHNIWSGSTVPIQGFPAVRPKPSGTIVIHELQYNIVAKNGTWNAYRLVDNRNNGVSAWYLSHSSVEPMQDIRRILRVAGSPYEDDGNTMNNDDTQREGVFVINRYDWGYYDRRYLEEIGEGVEEGQNDFLANSNSAGLVDYAWAQNQVQQWKEMRPSERPSSQAGIWMYSPHAEYMFCRFGFNETRDTAQSFLFFSSYTEFAQSSFEGLEEAIRKSETPRERFERQLQAEYDFSGIDELSKMVTPSDMGFASLQSPVPMDSQLTGPYKSDNVIFEELDIEQLRATSQRPQGGSPSRGFAGQWKRHIHELLNELTYYYLDRYIRPHIGFHGRAEDIASVIFPSFSEPRAGGLDSHLYRHFTQPDSDPVPGFDAHGVAERIEKFLASELNLSFPVDNIYPERACRVVAYLMTEILELANYRASDSLRPEIVPSDIRLSIYMDRDLFQTFQYSKAFWRGIE
ncbi:hypothetical protein TWF481_011140 [Arthrobotrys musiformis]|uniref:Uncharacterized protein n=1 Tax=Arthrobotrys musiformis TaxID=47236 RepID=A0AAV9VYJ2_9PEZI